MSIAGEYKCAYFQNASTLLSLPCKLPNMTAVQAQMAHQSLAERLVEARLASGFNVVKQAADAAGITPSALYQLENGTTRSLHGRTAAKLAEIYPAYEMRWLISGEMPKFRGARVAEPRTSGYESQVMRTNAETLAASVQLVRLACQNLEIDFEPEDPSDAEIVLLAYSYLQDRHEKVVTGENVVDFIRILRKQREQGVDSGISKREAGGSS